MESAPPMAADLPRPLASRDLRAALFDLDGTLADTAPDLSEALNRLLEEQGRAPLAYGWVRAHVSQGGAALVRLGFGSDLEPPRFEALRTRFLALYREGLCARTRLFPGISEVLDGIEARKMRWGIVTNKPAWLTEPLVSALGLDGRAACVVSGDTTGQRKPHPEPLLHACRTLHLAPQHCLYVGDDPRDIQAGNAAGMTTLAAGWGYLLEDSDLSHWQADGIIGDARDLLHWLPGP